MSACSGCAIPNDSIFFFHTCVHSFASTTHTGIGTALHVYGYVNYGCIYKLHARARIGGWTLQAEGAEGDVDKYIIANACALL